MALLLLFGFLVLQWLHWAVNRLLLNRMDFQGQIKEFKKGFDKELETYFSKTIKEVARKDLQTAELLVLTHDIALAGGKRLRPFLAFNAYCLLGGKDEKAMMRTAVAIELLHLFFLVHDDIIDRSDLRHAVASVHAAYAKKNLRMLGKEESLHLGNSMGIVAGDLLFSLANSIVSGSVFTGDVKCKLLAYMQQVAVETIIGQVQDISLEHSRSVKEKDVVSMYENKTAKYTFQWPLWAGAIATENEDEKLQKAISEYAVSIGIAFQIQDDLLGLFGQEKKTGKPADCDIKEGKRTLVVIKALETADSKQKKTLKRLLGKKDLSKKEANEFRDIIKVTGARQYADNLVREQIAKAKKIAGKIVGYPELREFLLGVADFLEKREM